ncbi:MAG: Uma2 family endonuclease [Thermoflexales bacterium]|nr:Uma2 family endonuclease [Thermoflexales bacterium]MDW8352100.1 Uma2 family endonuclease [Anaerolineae bacterium]
MIPFDQYARHDDSRMCEWIDGALALLPSLSQAQAHVRDLLLQMLGEYVEMNGIGLVIPAPFAIRMPEEMRRGREPDLLFVPNEFVETVQESYVNSHGVGLVVEVSDARNRRLDRVEKFRDYQQAGIPEYWIVDVDRREASFFVLVRRRYVRAQLDERGYYHSRALRGFAFAPATLWA